MRRKALILFITGLFTLISIEEIVIYFWYVSFNPDLLSTIYFMLAAFPAYVIGIWTLSCVPEIDKINLTMCG